MIPYGSNFNWVNEWKKILNNRNESASHEWVNSTRLHGFVHFEEGVKSNVSHRNWNLIIADYLSISFVFNKSVRGELYKQLTSECWVNLNQQKSKQKPEKMKKAIKKKQRNEKLKLHAW